MAKPRQKIKKSSSKRLFKKGLKCECRNFVPPPQRGGYRM